MGRTVVAYLETGRVPEQTYYYQPPIACASCRAVLVRDEGKIRHAMRQTSTQGETIWMRCVMCGHSQKLRRVPVTELLT